MNKEDLHKWIKNPSLLDGDSLVCLEQSLKEYPCSPVICMLYLMNLSAVGDNRFETELQRLSLYLPDRKKLFLFINGDKYKLPVTDKMEEKNDSFSLVDEFLSEHEQDKELSALIMEPTSATDYLHWTLSETEEKSNDKEEEHPMQHQDLIDSFLENGQQRLNLNTEGAAEQPHSQSASKSLDDSFFTETLAHIYIKQHRYAKALQIIQNLSLKYPEKNVYFADQIRFLKKLIINIQKN